MKELEGKRIGFQEAFPTALQTFPLSHLVGAILSNSECRENGRGMFYGVGGVRRRCIYVALAGGAARWDSLEGPGTLGTFLTN